MKLKPIATALAVAGLSSPAWASYDCNNIFANPDNWQQCIGLSDAPTTSVAAVNGWLGTSFTMEYKDDHPDPGAGTNNILFDIEQGGGDSFTMTFSNAYSGRLVVGLKFGGAGTNSVGYFDFGNKSVSMNDVITWTWSPSFRGDGISHASVFTVTAVPEPGTYALMAAGLAAIGFVARRRKSA
jgi:hypothetical protein